MTWRIKKSAFGHMWRDEPGSGKGMLDRTFANFSDDPFRAFDGGGDVRGEHVHSSGVASGFETNELRRCLTCGTRLNRYHQGWHCYQHEPPMTEQEVKALMNQSENNGKERAA